MLFLFLKGQIWTNIFTTESSKSSWSNPKIKPHFFLCWFDFFSPQTLRVVLQGATTTSNFSNQFIYLIFLIYIFLSQPNNSLKMCNLSLLYAFCSQFLFSLSYINWIQLYLLFVESKQTMDKITECRVIFCRMQWLEIKITHSTSIVHSNRMGLAIMQVDCISFNDLMSVSCIV